MATKRKSFRFDEGGDVAVDPLEEANKREPLDTTPGPVAAQTPPLGAQSFKDAFAEARAAGDKTFEWRGKSYTTALTPATKKAAPAASAAPAPAPAAPAASRSRVGIVQRMRDADAAIKGVRGAESSAAPAREVTKIDKSKLGRDNAFMGRGYAKGGKIDGIAQRGKTRGKLV